MLHFLHQYYSLLIPLLISQIFASNKESVSDEHVKNRQAASGCQQYRTAPGYQQNLAAGGQPPATPGTHHPNPFININILTLHF